MLGKDLQKVLKKIKMTDYEEFLAEPTKHGTRLLETVELEELIGNFTDEDSWKLLTKEQLLKRIHSGEDYRVSEPMIYRTNLEKDMGIQLYEEENDGTVLALIIFDDNPNLSKNKQLKIPYWFESRKQFEDWLEQYYLVYSLYPTEEHAVDVYAQISSKTVFISIQDWEDFTEITHIELEMDLVGGFDQIESLVYDEINDIKQTTGKQ